MAPIPESSYFPSLEKCLSGQELLISWRSAFSAISSSVELGNDHQAVIERFLSDPRVLELLSKPFDAYPQPSPTSKNTFETKTSAINVTPSSSSRYDIKIIKEDALWLSNSAKIDEVSALRVVVEECQTRTYTQLLSFFSEEELASIREASGNSKYSTQIPIALLSQGADPKAAQQELETKENRRLRIVRTYLSERRYLLKCAEQLFHVFFFNAEDIGKSKGPEATPTWLERSGRALAKKISEYMEREEINGDKFILRCIEAIDVNMRNLGTGAAWFDQDVGVEEIEIEWARNQLTEVTHGMELIWQFLTYMLDWPSSDAVLAWFRLEKSAGFFNSLEHEEPSLQELVPPLQSISIVISVTILRLGPFIELLDTVETISPNVSNDKAFILKPETLVEIHSILFEAADIEFPVAGPVVLAWAAILQNINARVNNKQLLIDEATGFERASSEDLDSILSPDQYADVSRQIRETLEEDPADFLARKAVNQCQVFQTLSFLSSRLSNRTDAYFSGQVGAQMRVVILDLIKNSTGVGYIPELIEAALSVLSGGQNYWDLLDSNILREKDDPVPKFLTDDVLLAAFLKNAQARYPYESLPFLQMIHALSASMSRNLVDASRSALDFLETIPEFTYALPKNFIDYETMQEEENNNNIRLTSDVVLFQPRSRARFETYGRSQQLAVVDEDFCIRSGTGGRIVSESLLPRIAFWYHPYSGLKYFGKLLETFLTACDEIDATTGMPADRQSVCEIIEVIATLLLSISKSAQDNPNSKEDSRRVLEIASSGLSRNRDIMAVVFDIFEQELQTQSALSGSDVPLDILISCVHFTHAVLSVFPNRVWPYLSRSVLLGAGRGSGRLSRIVESVELMSGCYDLLTSCCRLYDSLVEDFATNAIRRKGGFKSSARFQDGEDVGTGIPDHVLATIILDFTRYLVDVLESSCSWKFLRADDRRYLLKIIGTAFDKILRYSYGLQSPPTPFDEDGKAIKPKLKIMEALMPSATHLVESFLSTSSGDLRFQPLLGSYYNGLETPDLTTFLNRSNLWTASVKAILSFSETLLRVSTMLSRPSQLQSQLFKVSPLVARLYAINDAYRQPVVAIFEALIIAASNETSEPPSLLGHLGPQTAKNFIYVLSDLDKPLSRDDNVTAIWHFLSVIVSKRQQWFANYLLTGKTPRDALQNKPSGKALATLDKPPLVTALDTLSRINEAPRHEVLALLEFISLAQNFWPWTVCESPKYLDFIKAILDFVGNFHPPQQSAKLEANIDLCYQTRIAAYIAEILAMHLFHSRQSGSSYAIDKSFLNNLSYFSRFAVTVPDYNTSLHGQLKRNFEARYPGNTLSDLQRTTLGDRHYGKEYFYDLELADKMLSLDQAWTGRKDDGLRTEFGIANVNLSLVDAQIALFHSWKFLSIELSANLEDKADLQATLAHVAANCLIANARVQPPEEIFSRLSQARADLALVLTQRLVQTSSKVPETMSLLKTVWETIHALRSSFERAVPDGDILYYRSLLKVLFLAVRIHAEAQPQSEPENFRSSLRLTQNQSVISTILDILKYVVSMGLRELVSNVHDSPANSSPEDLALLTGIMQSCLRVPGIELCHSQIVSIMASNSTPHVAMTLFSWSERLSIDGDPIYGELSILFLLELSTMPLMAEQLAIDGILGHIASADITSHLRRPGVTPFSESAGLQRCYNIWARGILPLLLNLLDAVQSSVAAEVALFLNQFPILVAQSEQAFDAPETNRILARGQTKYITLTICTEVHTTAMIIFILNGFREALRGSIDIPDVKWDSAAVLENVEYWLGSQGSLIEKTLAMGGREVEMARKKNGESKSRLDYKVLDELKGIRDVLSGGDNV